MPATQDSQLAPRMAAKMESDAGPFPGEGGSPDAPQEPIKRDSSQSDPEWQNLNDMHGDRVMASDQKTGAADGWSATSRMESDQGGLPQRPDAE